MGVCYLRNLVHNQGDDSLPMNKKAIASVIALLTIGLLVASIPPAKAQFVLASWDYPDEYGQGIRNVALEQYINGEWVALTDPSPPKGYYYSGSAFNITSGTNGGGNISIVVQCFLNATLCGIDDIDDGPALIRHTITVTNTTATVFYQQGFDLTYQTDAYDPLYFYQYEVVANFVPISGITYTATITYEVFY